MRDSLIAFIKAVQAAVKAPMLILGGKEGLSITFGRQYADPDKVIVWRTDESYSVGSVEDGVDEFLAHYGLGG